jgi:hypothetical protein
MFSKILVKLIDQSIVPAVFLIVVRFVSVVGTASYFGIDFTFDSRGFVFSNPEHYILINSYSTLFMSMILAIGLLYVLLKAWIFHESHISPRITAQLFSLRMSTFIQNSYDLYSQGAIWLSYMFLLTISTGIFSAFGMIYTWVFITSLVLTILNFVILIVDVENEISLKKSQQLDAEEVVLNFGDIDKY